MHDGSLATIKKKKDEHLKLIIKKDGKLYKTGKEITGSKAEDMYYSAAMSGTPNKVVYGANLNKNEYGHNHMDSFSFL